MHVNCIAKRTIESMDGNLDDWQGVAPADAVAQRVGASETEKAYLPFKDWDRQSGGGAVTAWLAYDDQSFFYFAARVPRHGQGLPRFETRNDDRLLLPGQGDQPGQGTDLAGRRAPLFLPQRLRGPSGNGKHNVQIAFNVIPPEKKDHLQYPPGTMPRFCAYFDTDYEFALNRVGEVLWRRHRDLLPAAARHDAQAFLPPPAPRRGGRRAGQRRREARGEGQRASSARSPGAKCRRSSSGWTPARTIKFSFRVNNGRQRIRTGGRPQRVQRQLLRLPQRLVHALGQRAGVRSGEVTSTASSPLLFARRSTRPVSACLPVSRPRLERPAPRGPGASCRP